MPCEAAVGAGVRRPRSCRRGARLRTSWMARRSMCWPTRPTSECSTAWATRCGLEARRAPREPPRARARTSRAATPSRTRRSSRRPSTRARCAPTSLPAQRTASLPGPVTWRSDRRSSSAPGCARPSVGASQAGPECAMPQMRSLSSSACAPISDVSNGADGRQAAELVARQRAAPIELEAQHALVGRARLRAAARRGVSRSRNRVGRASSEVSEA